MLACHALADMQDDPSTFKAYSREIIDRHLRMNIHLEPKWWNDFWQIFLEFLETKGPVDDATKKAWLELGKQFSDECLAHLKNLGQPH
ncbi:unnamed protein product [Anisakis simplex]|uniref:Globin-like protein (inferred by orthology to a C. elegans protein) n=1 Tax=Anisakis simplex TaxID=6269 RepID=A0A0M3KDB7_ANISI|nr:unnamed protein product [Anisakis simplex]